MRREDWQADSLPPHLRMRFLLVDEQGASLAHGRSFNDLLRGQQRPGHGDRQRSGTAALPPEREIGVDDLDTIEPRLVVAGADGRASGLLFAALRVDEIHNRVLLHYLDSEVASRRQNRLGLQFLHGRLCSNEVGAVRKLCRAAVTSHSASWLSLGARASATELRSRLQAFLPDALFATRPGELISTARLHQLHEQAVARGVVRTATAVGRPASRWMPAIRVPSGSYISQLTWPSRYWLPSLGLMPTIWWCSMRCPGCLRCTRKPDTE